jgi:hypothetical protein
MRIQHHDDTRLLRTNRPLVRVNQLRMGDASNWRTHQQLTETICIDTLRIGATAAD